jgi:dipeptidase
LIKKIIIIFSCTLISAVGTNAIACTNFLFTRGATTDGSTMITYVADSHSFYGELYHTPAASYAPGDSLDIYEWDTGTFLGRIKQVEKTYSVVGLMNEHQVSIGETTWDGRKELMDSSGIMDYGSLMFIALQRAKTAREAIKIMTDLVDEYGYYSTGESFSISDPNEVWIMEMIGKGLGRKGAVWVARKIPDGYISAHANQARIAQFPLNDPENCMYDPETIDLAREMGYFSGKDKDFSFSAAYSPPDYGAYRYCESRVWQMFQRTAPSLNLSMDYVKAVEGADPLPLWIKPDKKISVKDVMALMRDHFEGTDFDMTNDIGAGPFKLPYRWRPLEWELDGVEYCNERATSTQQTGFSFVAQARSWLPNPIGGVFWFGVDDTYSTVYVPMYCSINRVPESYAVGTGDFHTFSWEAAFWIFNFVSNYAYLRYSDMIKDIQTVQNELEGKFLSDQPELEKAALKLFKKDPEKAIQYLSDYSVKLGNSAVQRWKKLGEFLIYKYLDGNVKDANGKVTHPGYPKEWYRKIVDETGDHFKVKALNTNDSH